MSSQPFVTHPTYVVVAIDHQMIVIQIQIGKNFIDDFLWCFWNQHYYGEVMDVVGIV
jgi:hypothetical protein